MNPYGLRPEVLSLLCLPFHHPSKIWCSKWDLNPHIFRYSLLRRGCLPDSTIRTLEERRGFEPLSAFTRSLLSRQDVSTTHTPLHWYSEWELNPYVFRQEVLSLPCLPFHHLSIKKGKAFRPSLFPLKKFKATIK